MKLFKLVIVALLLSACSKDEVFAQQPKRTEVIIENKVYKVWGGSQTL